jgi:hypothetical protein
MLGREDGEATSSTHGSDQGRNAWCDEDQEARKVYSLSNSLQTEHV